MAVKLRATRPARVQAWSEPIGSRSPRRLDPRARRAGPLRGPGRRTRLLRRGRPASGLRRRRDNSRLLRETGQRTQLRLLREAGRRRGSGYSGEAGRRAADAPPARRAGSGTGVHGRTQPALLGRWAERAASSRNRYLPATPRLAAATSTASVLSHSAAKSASTRSRACRQNRSASSTPSGRCSPLGLGPHAGRGHREQLGADVDDAAQEGLLALQLALPAGHPVERGPGQLAGGPLDVAQVLGERAELAVPAGQLAAADGQGRQPAGVEAAGPQRRPWPCGRAPASGSMMSPATDEVRVDRLAGDEQVHDLGRALEDAVDPQVAQDLLDRRSAARRGRPATSAVS